MSLFSTTYFGNIYYYAALLQSDKQIIEQHENYLKQSYRNRCSILSANGKIDLIVPVEKVSGVKSVITDVKIDYATRWQQIHKRSIVSAYKNSPYFDHYYDAIAPVFDSSYKYLFDMNMEITDKIAKLMRIDLNISLSEEFTEIGSVESDFRYNITPKIEVDSSKFHDYYQVFSEKMQFVQNLSILDLLFCEGTLAVDYLKKVSL